ncbi:MAG: glycosyltransferase family 2 protein [Bacteroidota bacterium]
MLSIIIVQHNNQNLTIQAIESISSNLSKDYEVIVVDNGSSDNDPNLLYELFPDIKLIVNKVNLGFGKANNIGAERAGGGTLLFLNNDTIIKSDFIEYIDNIFRDESSVGIIGPKLLNEDFSLQLSYDNLPSIINEFVTKFSSKLFYKNFKPVVKLKSRNYSQKKYVEFITGAALFIRKKIFIELGGFDEQIFMYFEDADLCKRVIDYGYKILFVPNIEIVHLRGASWNKNNSGDLKNHYRKSQLFYYTKHRSAFENLLLKYYLLSSGKYSK